MPGDGPHAGPRGSSTKASREALRCSTHVAFSETIHSIQTSPVRKNWSQNDHGFSSFSCTLTQNIVDPPLLSWLHEPECPTLNPAVHPTPEDATPGGH